MEKVNEYVIPYHWCLLGFWKNYYEKPLEYFENKLNSSDVVLDIGCGDGRLTSLIATRVKKVIGIDNQQFPLDMAKLILNNLKIKNVSFKKMDVLKLSYNKETFDKVFCFDVIEHIPKNEVNRLIEKIAMVLDKEGWLCLTTPNRRELSGRIFGHEIIEKHYYEYDVDELRNMFSPYFKNMRFIGVYLPILLLPKIEHFANILPLRYLFNAMVDLGYKYPHLSKTIMLIAQKK